MLNALLVTLAVTIPQPTANRIVDQAGLLTTDQTIELNNFFQDVQRTENVNFGLLTLTSLDDDPKVIAVRTLNFWQMSPDSVLLLVSTNPRKVFLQPGSNLSSKFTESVSQDLIRRTMVPSLRAGRTGEAVLSGFRAIRTVVATVPQPSSPAPEHSPDRQFITPVRDNTDNTMIVFTLFLLGGLGLILAVWATSRFLENRRARRGLRRGEATTRSFGGIVEPATTTRRTTSAPVATTTVVNTGGGSGDFVSGMMVNEMLHRHEPAPAPAPRYSPPSYTPPPSPPRRSSSSSWGSSSDDSSSGYGGGGSSWGSSDSGGSSSDGGGGGGSDW